MAAAAAVGTDAIAGAIGAAAARAIAREGAEWVVVEAAESVGSKGVREQELAMVRVA